jgi:hypothetical protein
MARGLQRQHVAVRAETGHLPKCDIGEIRLPAKRLAVVDIGQMHFNHWHAHSKNRITDSDAGMRVGPRIDDE